MSKPKQNDKIGNELKRISTFDSKHDRNVESLICKAKRLIRKGIPVYVARYWDGDAFRVIATRSCRDFKFSIKNIKEWSGGKMAFPNKANPEYFWYGYDSLPLRTGDKECNPNSMNYKMFQFNPRFYEQNNQKQTH